MSEDEAGASSQSDEAGAEALPKDWSFTSHLGEDLRGVFVRLPTVDDGRLVDEAREL